MSLFSTFLGFVCAPRRSSENVSDRSDFNSHQSFEPNRHFGDRDPASNSNCIDQNDLSDRASQTAIRNIDRARANYHLERRYL
ncbi:hypothetical protein [Thalassoporum mexicanum]|uniref:hypothetical protein n=1 Tax=Thalassoporum mexicanum TaxID=3457544 RepID=UPI0003158A50|nr:hypothetical protein [Pseudanabaena sp. PCC 7367]